MGSKIYHEKSLLKKYGIDFMLDVFHHFSLRVYEVCSGLNVPLLKSTLGPLNQSACLSKARAACSALS